MTKKDPPQRSRRSQSCFAMQESMSILKNRWAEAGIPLAEPSSTAEVVAFFEKVKWPATPDVVVLYTCCGGFKEDHYDEECFSLWPFSKIQHEAESKAFPFLQFADFLIDSHRYAFVRENETESSVWMINLVDSSLECRVSETIAKFFGDYARSADRFSALHG